MSVTIVTTFLTHSGHAPNCNYIESIDTKKLITKKCIQSVQRFIGAPGKASRLIARLVQDTIATGHCVVRVARSDGAFNWFNGFFSR